MKKILIIVLAIMVVIIGFSAKVYIKAMEPINQAEKVAKEKAENEADLQAVKRVTLYNGNETYYIIDGVTKEDKEVYVWVSADSEDEIIIKNKKDGISKEEAIEKVMNKKIPMRLFLSTLVWKNQSLCGRFPIKPGKVFLIIM